MRQHRADANPTDEHTIIEAKNIMLEDLSGLVTLLGQEPLFTPGARVMLITQGDEKTWVDFGYVVGMEFNPKDCHPAGWWYAVYITAGDFAGHREWFPEREVYRHIN